MEQIKIVDKLTLRQEALRMSIELSKSHAKCISGTIDNAETFEKYLQGSADLPEYENTNKFYTEILAKMQESLKHNQWISADSEMKPAKDTTVLIQSKNDGCVLGVWDGKMWINHNADYSSTSLNESGEILGWMPIPPFTQPTL